MRRKVCALSNRFGITTGHFVLLTYENMLTLKYFTDQCPVCTVTGDDSDEAEEIEFSAMPTETSALADFARKAAAD